MVETVFENIEKSENKEENIEKSESGEENVKKELSQEPLEKVNKVNEEEFEKEEPLEKVNEVNEEQEEETINRAEESPRKEIKMTIVKRVAQEETETEIKEQPRKRVQTTTTPIATSGTQDSLSIAQHYNSRPDAGKQGRETSKIIKLRNFNNWVKSVLMDLYVGRMNGKSLLDLGCGKGGDLNKWHKAGLRQVVGIDIAEMSIEDAKKRYADMRRPNFKADFFAFDAFHNNLKQLDLPIESFDALSSQFAYHYSFETEESAEISIRNVSSHLKSGGFFFGTTTNAELIKSKLKESKDFRISNSVYNVKLAECSHGKLDDEFGVRFYFSLESAIDDCPEYLIPMSILERIAKKYDLVMERCLPFQDFYLRYSERPEYADLLRRMDVIGRDNSFLSEEERQVAELYLTFCFRKL